MAGSSDSKGIVVVKPVVVEPLTVVKPVVVEPLTVLKRVVVEALTVVKPVALFSTLFEITYHTFWRSSVGNREERYTWYCSFPYEHVCTRHELLSNVDEWEKARRSCEEYIKSNKIAQSYYLLSLTMQEKETVTKTKEASSNPK